MAAKKETVEASEIVENTESCTGATDMVEIEIFKDSDRYKDDVVVALNGKVYVIKRGVRVKVPRAVKEILDQDHPPLARGIRTGTSE